MNYERKHARSVFVEHRRHCWWRSWCKPLDASHGICVWLATDWDCRRPRDCIPYSCFSLPALAASAQDFGIWGVDDPPRSRICSDPPIHCRGPCFRLVPRRWLARREERFPVKLRLGLALVSCACCLVLVPEPWREQQRTRRCTEWRPCVAAWQFGGRSGAAIGELDVGRSWYHEHDSYLPARLVRSGSRRGGRADTSAFSGPEASALAFLGTGVASDPFLHLGGPLFVR